ncbi:hypothetical protein ACFVHB_29990 [Kitasatospora sp. NPDC127111]|uniref:hypothetical protein n=1 Tax=Kitasatospora sp. NPDC127111 TaxID=3345363 RepID=UPI00363390F3
MRTTTTRAARAAGLLLAAGLVGLTGATAAHAGDAQPGRPGKPGSGTDTGIPAGNFVLCSHGTYPSYAVFPKRGDMATVVVEPGRCVSLSLSGQSRETVVLYGLKPNREKFKIGTDTFDDRVGERIRTLNTPDNDDWTTF